MWIDIIRKRTVTAAILVASLTLGPVLAQTMVKAQVANLISKVENGVDDFRDYLKKQGDNARDASASPEGQSRRAKRGAQPATDSQKTAAREKKDELDDALGDLNRSTNRLRRKFDATDKWIETKAQVEAMIDDGRKINQALTRGNYGTQASKLWGVLRNGMNDLARAYNVTPLGV